MDLQTKARLNEGILEMTAQRYGIAREQLESLGGFESFIYAFTAPDGGQRILRLAHTARRSEQLILGEVDFINHLAAGGATVARAVPSANTRLVEPIDDGHGGAFLATAFERAPGVPPKRFGHTPALYVAWGRLLARMHAASVAYTPTDAAWRRPDHDGWASAGVEDLHTFLPADQPLVRHRHHELRAALRDLPRDAASFGLVHYDAHGGNLLVDGPADDPLLTVFDFDDCCHAWFAADIAIVLYYVLMHSDDPAAMTAQVLPDLLRGYRDVRPLDPVWLAAFPLFLKQREFDLYAVVHRSFDVASPGHADSWGARFVAKHRPRIEQGVPVVDIDFAALAGE
ncbi:MAG: phosphotransferase enzyme family protein [Planctomycetota bacterium]